MRFILSNLEFMKHVFIVILKRDCTKGLRNRQFHPFLEVRNRGIGRQAPALGKEKIMKTCNEHVLFTFISTELHFHCRATLNSSIV